MMCTLSISGYFAESDRITSSSKKKYFLLHVFASEIFLGNINCLCKESCTGSFTQMFNGLSFIYCQCLVTLKLSACNVHSFIYCCQKPTSRSHSHLIISTIGALASSLFRAPPGPSITLQGLHSVCTQAWVSRARVENVAFIMKRPHKSRIGIKVSPLKIYWVILVATLQSQPSMFA